MNPPTIHFAFFSCGAHVRYLEMALRSLVRVKGAYPGKVYVGEDPDDPIDAKSKDRLGALGLSIEYATWGKVTGYGEDTVVSELAAFSDVAAQVDRYDWIAKVDSDVLFLNDWIFTHVLDSQADLVGHKERAWRTFAYSQGGCYFLRAGFVAALAGIGPPEVELGAETLLKEFHDVAEAKGMWKMPQCPEDALIHRLVTKRNGRVRLKNYYLPLWQLDRLTIKNGKPRLVWPTLAQIVAMPRVAMGIVVHNIMLVRNRYSVIHFMSCKEKMAGVFEKLGMGERHPHPDPLP